MTRAPSIQLSNISGISNKRNTGWDKRNNHHETELVVSFMIDIYR